MTLTSGFLFSISMISCRAKLGLVEWKVALQVGHSFPEGVRGRLDVHRKHSVCPHGSDNGRRSSKVYADKHTAHSIRPARS